MNEVVKKFFLAGYKGMPEMQLRIPSVLEKSEITQSACGPFTKNKEKIQKLKETGSSRYFSQNEVDKAYFQHNMADGDFKYLTRQKASDKILHDRAFDISKNPKYDGYQRGLASMVYNFFNKKSALLTGKSAYSCDIKKENMSIKELAEELHKPIFRKLKKYRFTFYRQY